MQKSRKTPVYQKIYGYKQIFGILARIAFTSYGTIRLSFVFQQDSAKFHTSKTTLEWKETYGISILEWISSSWDLSLMENLWYEIKKVLWKYSDRKYLN